MMDLEGAHGGSARRSRGEKNGGGEGKMGP
jgi:hypothetical protein